MGGIWNVKNDYLLHNISLGENVCKMRGIFCSVHKFYDPLYILSQVVVRAKIIFQRACELNLGWDDELPAQLNFFWSSWFEILCALKDFRVPLCYFLMRLVTQLKYIFFVTVVNFRMEPLHICVSIVMSKISFTPLKRDSFKTIPRIELNAAKVGVELLQKLLIDLEYNVRKVILRLDSLIVLSYIASDNGRLQRFVSSRVACI